MLGGSRPSRNNGYNRHNEHSTIPERASKMRTQGQERLTINVDDTVGSSGEDEAGVAEPEGDESQRTSIVANADDQREGRPFRRGKYQWSEEEQSTLLAALTEVGGPFWQDILSLYGPNGSVNKTLKNRTSNQLSHKASYLKTTMVRRGQRVPAALAHVNTRAYPEPKGRRKRAAILDQDQQSDRSLKRRITTAPPRATSRANNRTTPTEQIDLTGIYYEEEGESKDFNAELEPVKSDEGSTTASVGTHSATGCTVESERELIELQLRQLQAKRTAANLEDQEIALQIKLVEMSRR